VALNRKLPLLGLSVLLLLLGVSGVALAQTTSGTIRGEVVDQADAPLEGVSLKVTSSSLQGVRDLTTDDRGAFKFLALPPGTYRLDVEKEGFKTIIRTNLVVSMGRTVSLKLVMELPEVGETVQVIDRRPVIDTEQATQSMTLSSSFLKNLPSGRSFQDAVQFLPGVTGGSNPNINGGTMQSNQYYMDGTQTTDPVTGTFSMNFNFDAIEDLEVITAGYDARYNQGLGGTVNIVTKSGGNTFEGTFSGYFEGTGFQQSGNKYISLSRSSYTNVEANASVGGPIVKDRFWFFVAYQFNRNVRLPSDNTDIGRDFAKFPFGARTWQSHFIVAKLTAQPIARNKFTLSFRADPTTIDNNNAGSPYLINEALSQWKQGGFSTSLSHEIQIAGRAVLTTTASYQYSTIFIQPMLWTDCTERDPIGRCLDSDKQQPGIRGQNAGLSHGSYGSYNLNRRHTLTVRSDVEIGIDRLLGSHTINAGVDVNPIWSVYDFGYIGNQLLIKEPTDSNGDGLYNPEEVNDLESYDPVARYVIVNNDREKTPGVLFNVYLQDRWRPVRGLMIQLGARYLRANLKNNIGDTIIDTSALSWGATVGWDPFRDGKTYLLASYAQIVDPGLLSLSGYINQSSFNFEYYPWDAGQQKWSEESTRASTPASNITHPDFVVARNHEVLIRAQREIARDLAAEVSFVYRTFTNMWEDDEVNVVWNADGTDSVGFRTGQGVDIYRLRTPQDGHRNYWGLTFMVRKQLSDNFEMLASYNFSRLTSNAAGRGFSDRLGTSGDFDNAVQRYYEDGIATSDQPHVFRLQAAYDNPNVWKASEKFSMGYSLGGVMQFASGAPLNRLQYNSWRQGYSNYVYKRGTRERLPAYVNLDLRAALAMKIAGTQVDIILQVFNVLNSLDIAASDSRALDSAGDVVEGSRGGAVFAQPVSYYQPRRFELGVRFSF